MHPLPTRVYHSAAFRNPPGARRIRRKRLRANGLGGIRSVRDVGSGTRVWGNSRQRQSPLPDPRRGARA